MRKYTITAVIITAIMMFTMTVSSSANLFYPEYIEDPDGFYAASPTMFQDINGTYWMGFIHIEDEERNIGICHSLDMKNWSDPIVVEANVYLHSSNIVFFQSLDGMYNLIYRECFITNPEASVDHMLIRSMDCSIWSDPVIITICGYEVSALQLRDGTYCLTVDFLSSLIFRWTSDPTNWYTLRHIKEYDRLHEDWIHAPFIYEDNVGSICVTFTKGYSDKYGPMQVYSAFSEDNGTSWTEPIKISNGSGETHSSITQDSEGKYWAVWESNGNGSSEDPKKVIRYSTSWDLNNWTDPEHLIGNEFEHSFRSPEIRCMPDGRIYLAASYIDLPSQGGYHPSQLYLVELQGDIDKDGHDFKTDRFPDDPAASKDTDGDGYPDEWNEGKSKSDSTTGLKLDEFPDNPKEWADADKDGYGDNEEDQFPGNLHEWNDSDKDGYPDNSDAFPDDPADWRDTDGDGIGDNRDYFPDDAYNDTNNDGRMDWYEEDSDGDGVVDHFDKFPTDPAASVDSDDDGYPDSWNPGMKESDSTTLLKMDHFPLDPDLWEKREEGSALKIPIVWILIVILIIVLIAEIIGFVVYKRTR